MKRPIMDTSGGKLTLLLLLGLSANLIVSGQSAQNNQAGGDGPVMATVAIMPLFFFPNTNGSSSNSAEIGILKTNASRQAEGVSNTSLSDATDFEQRRQNMTREEQRSSDRRIHTALILNRILFQLGMTSPPSVVPSVTPSSLLGEAGRQLMDAVARNPPPTKSAYFVGNNQGVENQVVSSFGNQEEKNSATSYPGQSTRNPHYQHQQPGQNPNSMLVKEFATAEIYAQRLQSFYPSCEIPNFTLPSVWKSPNQREMRLYFDLNIPRLTNSVRRSHTTIMWAKLRLFVTAGPGCRQALSSGIDTTSYRELLRCDNRITISLFQYMRPLSDHRGERRRMLDSKVVTASYRGSIEFNMQSVINYWQKHQDSNYGLVVLVEDAQGMALPPAMYLQQMNCSDHEIPLPNLAELYGESVLNKTLVNGQVRARYPTMDIMSMEAAREEEASGPVVMTTLRSNTLHRPAAFPSPSATLSPASLLFQQLLAAAAASPTTSSTSSSYYRSK